MKSSERPLGRLLGFFFRKYWASILAGCVTIMIIDVGELILPMILKSLVEAVEAGNPIAPLKQALGWIAGIVFCQVIGRYVWRVTLARSAMSAGADFRSLFSRQIFEVAFGSIERRKVGELMTLATSDVENMRMALGPGIISLTDALFYCITVPIAMVWIAPVRVLWILLPLLLIPVLVIVFHRRIFDQSARVQSLNGELGTLTQEMVAGVRPLKQAGSGPTLSDRIGRKSRELNRRQVGLQALQSSMGPTLEFLLSTSLVLLFASSPGVPIGVLVALQRLVQKLMWPMTAVGMAVIYFQKARASGKDFYRFLEEIRAESLEGSVGHPDGVRWDGPMLECRSLNHGPIRELSFTIHEGEWIGLKGPVASGKSTLLGLILRFQDPPRGTLFFRGVDVLDWDPPALRKELGSVLQEPYLFQGTIRSNLQTGEELPLLDAISLAGLSGPGVGDRIDEELGEKGMSLSGGQKQRVAIARVLRKPASLFLLDDPLSSVDEVTSRQVLMGLRRVWKDGRKTVLYVSHRPEHLGFCDRWVDLDRSGERA